MTRNHLHAPAKWLFMLLLPFFACTPRPGSTQQPAQLKAALDSLGRIYAPDKRVALWKYKQNAEDGYHGLHLMVDKPEAMPALLRTLQRFGLDSSAIELLPADGSKAYNALANNSVINLRSAPHHSAELATQVLLGTPLKILKSRGEWFLVQSPNHYIAWTDDDALVAIDDAQRKEYRAAFKVVFNQACGFSYSKPDEQSLPVSDLVLGCLLPVDSTVGAFYRVHYPDKRVAYVKRSDCLPFQALINRAEHVDTAFLIRTARRFHGLPYLWGGTSIKGIDCSGFTSSVYFMSGIILQRDASQQTRYGQLVTTRYRSDSLRAGDLLFFGRPASDTMAEKVSHVALYMGSGYFIHASGKVRISSMDPKNPRFIASYPPRFVRARRIIGHEEKPGIVNIKDNDFYRQIIRDEDQ